MKHREVRNSFEKTRERGGGCFFTRKADDEEGEGVTVGERELLLFPNCFRDLETMSKLGSSRIWALEAG